MGKLPLYLVRNLRTSYSTMSDEDWRERASCRGIDTEEFYPGKGESGATAKKICKRCQVRSQCLEYAMAMADDNGIWGGIGEGERRRMLRGELPRAA